LFISRYSAAFLAELEMTKDKSTKFGSGKRLFRLVGGQAFRVSAEEKRMRPSWRREIDKNSRKTLVPPNRRTGISSVRRRETEVYAVAKRSEQQLPVILYKLVFSFIQFYAMQCSTFGHFVFYLLPNFHYNVFYAGHYVF
jgi:hypothetical protein